MDPNHIEVPLGPVVGGLMTVAMGFLAWVIKIAAKQLLIGFQAALAQHSKALEDLRKELAATRDVDVSVFRTWSGEEP